MQHKYHLIWTCLAAMTLFALTALNGGGLILPLYADKQFDMSDTEIGMLFSARDPREYLRPASPPTASADRQRLIETLF